MRVSIFSAGKSEFWRGKTSAILLATLLFLVTSGDKKEIAWENSFADAIKKAKTTNRLILADFTSSEN